MKQTQLPNGAYLQELGRAFDRFAELVEAENTALERRDTIRLHELTPQKVEAGKALDALTRDFHSRLTKASEEEMQGFGALVDRTVTLRPLLERNMALLNAAKVTTATRIEAGLAAWRRSLNEKSLGYGDDGRTTHPEQSPPRDPGAPDLGRSPPGRSRRQGTMDLRIALNAALSGIATTAAQSSVAATNIANADANGYTAKVTNLTTMITAGTATGVDLSSISSYVDENLVRSLMAATCEEGFSQTVADYLESLSNAVGSTDSNVSIAALVIAFQTAVAELAVTSESDSLKYLVVDAAVDLAEGLSSLSDTIQQQRADADQQIETAVSELNAALEKIDSLNEQIVKAKALGNATGDLEDARRTALAAVAEKLDISYFETSASELNIYTKSGQPLLTGTVHSLSYEATGAVSSGMAYPGSFDGIMLDGKDVTSVISGGEIGALIELRDETLPAIQDELDELAATLIETVNTVSNRGTANPAATSLTGTTAVTPTDAATWSGTLRIALLDSDGIVDTVVDLDLSTCTTYQDLADAIDAVAGISASFDAEGHLVISSDDSSLGIAVNEMNSAVGGDGVGASYFFGLNDIFTGNSAETISVNSTLKSDSTRVPVSTLSDDASLAAGDIGFAAGDGSIAEALEDVLDGSMDFAAAGSLSGGSRTLADYASTVVTDIATKASEAASEAETAGLVADSLANTFSNDTGVNIDEETAILAALENQYSACSQVVQILEEMFDALLNAVAS